MIGKWHLGSDPVGFDRWEILPGQGAYRNPVLYTATGEKTYTGRLRDRRHHRSRRSSSSSSGRANKPFFLMMHHKAPHRPWEPSDHIRRRVRGAADSRAGDVLGFLRDAHRCAAREPAARRRRSHQPRSEADAAAGPRRRSVDEVARHQAGLGRRSCATARRVTLTGEALARWKYQRYMQDYLATRAVGGRQRRPGARGARQGRPRAQHDGHLHERPGILPRRPRPLRQAVHVRGIDPDAVSRPLARRHQAGHEERCDRAQRRLRADVSRCSPGCRHRPRCRAAASWPCCAAARRRTGARRCTTATTTTPAITTRGRTTACARARTS